MPSGRNIIFLSLHGSPERRSLLLQSLQLETITDLVDILSKDGRLIARKIRVSPCFLDKQREKPNFSLIQQKEGEEDRELKSFSIPQFHVQSHVSMLYSPISYTITYFCNHATVDRFNLDLNEKKKFYERKFMSDPHSMHACLSTPRRRYPKQTCNKFENKSVERIFPGKRKNVERILGI